jgi:hypothetical protein
MQWIMGRRWLVQDICRGFLLFPSARKEDAEDRRLEIVLGKRPSCGAERVPLPLVHRPSLPVFDVSLLKFVQRFYFTAGF